MRSPTLSPAVDLLRGAPDAVALWTDAGALTYADLVHRVAERGALLGTTRRLVMIACRNTTETIVTYLAALAGAHPVLLAPGGDGDADRRTRAALVSTYDPDIVAAEAALDVRRDGSAHLLHEDLALLASTSGSTGSPKLVRLSAENLRSNAAAISEYLGLDERDRGITALPLHYCYGLSVINSHLHAGASVALTERSYLDDRFWAEAARARITGLAGVPYSFALLEAAGGTERLPGSLRYVTQAGGRLPAEKVAALARAGERQGFSFYVMYGQTEATARMAYLPPEDAIRAAGAIGRAIPGGAFRIDPRDGAVGAGTGELVYTGPNVMLGYAESAGDLALGRTIDELRTGDLARWREDGYVEIVGRLNRFVKIFGLRIDLDAVQQHLESLGIPARTAAVDERLLVFVRRVRDVGAARDAVARRIGIPARDVIAHRVDDFPLTSSGKSDTAALVALHHVATAAPTPRSASAAGTMAAEIRDVLALCTSRPDATAHDSFATLGGDSLGYVEAAVRLEDHLGTLPRDWPSLTAAELAAIVNAPAVTAAEPARRRGLRLRDLETPVLLRALAIVLIVGTHAHLFRVQGGAHLLLIVAGYNVARFALSPAPGSRPRRLLAAIGQVAVPAMLWIAALVLFTGRYAPTTALLLNNAMPYSEQFTSQWQFWFLEAVVWSMIGLAAVFSIPAFDRLERRAPWAVALTTLVATAGLRYALIGVTAHDNDRYALPIVLWCIVLGWVVARAENTRRRLVASAATVLLVAGFFGEPLRETIVIAGALTLIWIPAIRIPAALRPVIAAIASASFFVYLTHWVVYPPFSQTSPLFGTVLSFAVGIAASYAHRRVTRAAPRLLARARARRPRPGRSVAPD
ncbi:AMP-binding protein [Microbacterium sp. ASV81]|uniref:AMP-binding protein n=1 Tax=Microbacterium capsulatum TaxID=3041921 RepID=A0ABU0XCR4_9MICO|nr:AMP-binding protein [Microbacterium sp. ASV81]MDQ4212494.1 AMP-binding protein [Microbacterium sp. ASV81]